MNADTTPAGPRLTTSLNLMDIPYELHGQYKAVCARRGRSMRGMFIAFMRDACRDKGVAVDLSKLSRAYQTPR